VCGPLEADPEYQLIVEANNITVEIDNEISKFCYIIPDLLHITSSYGFTHLYTLWNIKNVAVNLCQ